MQTTIPVPTAEYQRLKGIEKEFDQMKDMPWSESGPRQHQYDKVNQDGNYRALEIKHESLDFRYNKLRKENVRISRDHDELSSICKSLDSDREALRKIRDTMRLEIEEYKKSIKALENEIKSKGLNYWSLFWLLLTVFLIIFSDYIRNKA